MLIQKRSFCLRMIFIFLLNLFSLPVALAQMEHHHGMQAEQDHHANTALEFLTAEAAGTSLNPHSAMSHMEGRNKGNWTLFVHGFAFLDYVNQSGPRGDDKVFSTNHLMLMAARPINEKSALVLRGMFTLEPATITDRQFPELFQTGETAFGKPIVDGQHPHEAFMEVSVQYARQLNEHALIHFYAAPVGDPALGPVAYPHRVSAQELPQATLGHHLQDSSHVVNEVLTAGIQYKFVHWEASAFHGAEPDELRWNIDHGKIDSWSTRFSVTPTPNIIAQISTGRLKKPEELEPGDTQRTTASISWNRPLPDGSWAATFLYGMNHKIQEKRNVHSVGLETLYKFKHLNYLTARAEFVDKDELFSNDPVAQEKFESEGISSFKVDAFTFGYARDFDLIRGFQTGVGGNFTLYSFPEALKPFYGDAPKSLFLYFRIRMGHSH